MYYTYLVVLFHPRAVLLIIGQYCSTTAVLRSYNWTILFTTAVLFILHYAFPSLLDLTVLFHHCKIAVLCHCTQ